MSPSERTQRYRERHPLFRGDAQKTEERYYLERAAENIERELLDWLGLSPDSDAPNTEPDYEARLRKLGAHLFAKKITVQECAASLALTYLSGSKGHPKRCEFVGRARQLLSAARALEGQAVGAEDLGRALEERLKKLGGDEAVEKLP